MMLDALMQHYVLVLSMHFTCASVILSEMFTNVVAWQISPNFTALVLWSMKLVHLRRRMNNLYFEVKRSKVDVTTRPDIVQNILLGLIWHCRTSGDD